MISAIGNLKECYWFLCVRSQVQTFLECFLKSVIIVAECQCMYVTKRGTLGGISSCYFIVMESGPQMSDREVNCTSKAITDLKGAGMKDWG